MLGTGTSDSKIPLSPFTKGEPNIARNGKIVCFEAKILPVRKVPPFEKGGSGGILGFNKPEPIYHSRDNHQS
jgi:hypothetical protein